MPLFEAIATPATWQHKQVGQTESVEAIIRRAHDALALSGGSMSPSKVSRIVRQRARDYGIDSAGQMVSRYMASASATQRFDDFCLTYTDITGETAAANVDRERRAATR